MTIGNRLLIFINQEFNSQINFAKKLEIKPTQVSKWLKANNISVESIIKIGNNCPELSMDWLIMGRGEMKRTTVENENIFSENQVKYVKKPKEDQLNQLLKVISQQSEQLRFMQDMIDVKGREFTGKKNK
jgi:hypothetical protein